MIADYQVIIMDMPVPEMVTKNPDDSYTIFINANLSRTQQEEVCLHALKHIKNDDFYKENVNGIEAEAHFCH